jgi:hypothetical protein
MDRNGKNPAPADDGDAPPDFAELPDYEQSVPKEGISSPASHTTQHDFPNVGELPIPNVNPKTAHVLSYRNRMR